VSSNFDTTCDSQPEPHAKGKYTSQPTPLVRVAGPPGGPRRGRQQRRLLGQTRPARLDSEDSQNWGANKMAKADLEKALADSFALCDKAFAAVTEANMMERNGNRSKIGTLMYNTSHINEHYGNFVTYMRLNNLVPPSTAARMAK
jgi:hypothetical protein